MKAIITGAGGQDGYYLSELLRQQGCDVIGVSRRNGFDQTDITHYPAVADLVARVQPDFIFHLAANSTTQHSALLENHATIATGTLHLLEAVKQKAPAAKVFISGSGLQFENQNRPIKETDPFAANDAYAISRIQSVYAARYFRTQGIQTYVGYFFNHDSPLRNEHHMTKKIAEAAKRIAAGSTETIAIGDLDAIKEYTFAGDVVRGVWTLVNQQDIVEANISSGKGYSIRDWLKACFDLVNKDWQEHVTINPGFKSAYRQLVSDPSRIRSLGWTPTVDFHALAKLMMQ